MVKEVWVANRELAPKLTQEAARLAQLFPKALGTQPIIPGASLILPPSSS